MIFVAVGQEAGIDTPATTPKGQSTNGDTWQPQMATPDGNPRWQPQMATPAGNPDREHNLYRSQSRRILEPAACWIGQPQPVADQLTLGKHI
jgi:hypothetical protein